MEPARSARVALGLRRAALLAAVPLVAAATGCTTVDPGPNFVVPSDTFDADFFYCHVEPGFLAAKQCGSGDPTKGDPSSGCHFNAASVSGMALLQHTPVDCGGGDHPVDRTTVGAGSAAAANLQSASLEMSRDYTTAPIYVRPLGANHPRAIFLATDPTVDLLRQWAAR